ncbi:hypothetical protein M434DRAFT_35957 [Hypoxylon sp. CO27-5]|nr:hypothetical protein M434DRAFT_35957 [Hypoxylon sp. CO27-5]
MDSTREHPYAELNVVQEIHDHVNSHTLRRYQHKHTRSRTQPLSWAHWERNIKPRNDGVLSKIRYAFNEFSQSIPYPERLISDFVSLVDSITWRISDIEEQSPRKLVTVRQVSDVTLIKGWFRLQHLQLSGQELEKPYCCRHWKLGTSWEKSLLMEELFGLGFHWCSRRTGWARHTPFHHIPFLLRWVLNKTLNCFRSRLFKRSFKGSWPRVAMKTTNMGLKAPGPSQRLKGKARKAVKEEAKHVVGVTEAETSNATNTSGNDASVDNLVKVAHKINNEP